MPSPATAVAEKVVHIHQQRQAVVEEERNTHSDNTHAVANFVVAFVPEGMANWVVAPAAVAVMDRMAHSIAPAEMEVVYQAVARPMEEVVTKADSELTSTNGT